MKTIKLTQGFETKVDDDLYDWLNQWKWYYRKRVGNRRGGDVVRTMHGTDKNGISFSQTLYMTSLICPKPRGYMVDHINQDPLDNQRHNLRVATPSINIKNSGVRTNNKLQEKFIHWAHHKQRFILQLDIGNGKRTWQAFRTLKEAVDARDARIN